MFVNFNKMKIPEKLFQFGEKESVQCAGAYLNQSILFSVPVNEKWESAKLAGILKSGDERQNVEISNIAVMEHIKTHEEQLQIRRYEFNPKHKIDVGWGNGDGSHGICVSIASQRKVIMDVAFEND